MMSPDQREDARRMGREWAEYRHARQIDWDHFSEGDARGALAKKKLSYADEGELAHLMVEAARRRFAELKAVPA